jgi:hypothetical protein
LRRPLNLRVPDCWKRRKKSAIFSGADLNYSQISESGRGEWFDIPLRDRDASLKASNLARKRSLHTREVQYGRVVVKSEIGGPLKHQILVAADVRKRVSPRIWAKIADEPTFKAMLNSIVTDPNMTRAMKGC